MPTEAQLKAQMQAAIAKKKRDLASPAETSVKAGGTPSPTPTPSPTTPPSQPETPSKPSVPVDPASSHPAAEPETAKVTPPKPPIEQGVNSGSVTNQHFPLTDPVADRPVHLTFYGHSIRYTSHKQEVYFAVIDMLPLSKAPNYQNQFIEFKNNPKTKDTADSLIKILTFPGLDESEKTEGATAQNMLAIFREMELSAPGPMGRWLRDHAASYKPSEDKT